MFLALIKKHYKEVHASLKDWSGVWVHYTDIHKLGINPKQFHLDLAGIYLFPQEFKTSGTIWKRKKYKYIIKIKNTAKVLDLSTLQETDLRQILEKLDIPYRKYLTDNVPLTTDNFWETLKNYYVLSKHKQAGLWNKEFKRLGYDAIFDDTGSIHSAEVQMVVLNPAILEVIDVEEQNIKRGQYDRIKEHLELLAQYLKPYGKIEMKPLKKKKDLYSKNPKIKGDLRLWLGEQYIDWQIEEDETNHLMWVRTNGTDIPHLKDNWGSFSEHVEYLDKEKIKGLVTKVMDKVKIK